MDEREFGAKIKARREALGLSQQDLAVALDLDQGKISLIEKGMRRVDSIRELPILSIALQCPISFFYESKVLPQDKIPGGDLVKQLFPGIEFSVAEIKRIAAFLEPVVKSYVRNDPSLNKKLSKNKGVGGEDCAA
jgi:transcriptional regulator with XRE-family HTH domain